MQVDLGRGACAFNQHQIVLLHQFMKRLLGIGPKLFAALAPGHGGQVPAHLAQHHHLAAHVVLGFEQHRVHADLRPCAGGQGLEVLCAADLAPAALQSGHHTGVVAHVLRFEWRHLQTLARIPAAQRGGEPAFACVAGGAQHHDGAGGQSATSLFT